MTTEVILMKDIDGLGEEGDIRKVAPGYARNYLLPFKFAAIKNQAALKKLEANREEINQRKTKKLEASNTIHEKVNGLEISFQVNAGESGKLFGSIAQVDILNAITEKGFEIDKNQVLLPKPIKSIGEYDVSVRFYGGLIAKIKVKVMDQNVNESDDSNKKPDKPDPQDEKQEQAAESVQ